jgi:hypothetical protein
MNSKNLRKKADNSVVECPVYIREVGRFNSPSAYQYLFLVSGSLLLAPINKYLETKN